MHRKVHVRFGPGATGKGTGNGILASGLPVLLHTASGDGGTFRVVVRVAGEMARVEVHDGGSDAAPDAQLPRTAGESGVGLYLVDEIAARWGYDGGPSGRMVWFEVELKEG